MIPAIVIAGVIVVAAALYYVANVFMYKKVGPNEVLIISGGKRRKVTDPDGTEKEIGYHYVVGGGSFVNPVKESAQILPLEVYNIRIKTPEVLTAKGIHIVAEATAQVKIASDDYSIRNAAEQFLSTGAGGIKEVSEQILEGYMRAVIGHQTVEDIYRNRDGFNEKVVVEAVEDFKKMGLMIISFTIKDISDNQGYLASLGKPRIAEVKRDAQIAEAEAEKETIIKAAAARKDGDVAKFQAEEGIAEANRDYELKRAKYQSEINGEKARSDMTYEMERQKMLIDAKKAEYAVKLLEKNESIKLEEAEIVRKEKELEASVKKNAEAHKYQIEIEAEAESLRVLKEAGAKAEAAKMEGMAEIEVTKQRGISKIAYSKNMGLAEAEVEKTKGEIEAEIMAKKAVSFASYNEAAIYQMLIDKMPELARAVSEPLSQVDKIVMIGENADGASKLTGQVAKILAQMPEVVEGLTGTDLKQIFAKFSKKDAE
ncbi:MAG: flotillin [FCB group bacterium]|nr:flotillin [FCB group bacterium]